MSRIFWLGVAVVSAPVAFSSCSTSTTGANGVVDTSSTRPAGTGSTVATSLSEEFSFAQAVEHIPAGTYRYDASWQIVGDDEFSFSCDVDVVAQRKRCVDNMSARGRESIVDSVSGVAYTSIASVWPAELGSPPEGVSWVDDGLLPAVGFVHPLGGFERFADVPAEQVGEAVRDGETLRVFAVQIDREAVAGLTDFYVDTDAAQAKFYVSAANVLRGVSFEADTFDDGPATGTMWVSPTPPARINLPPAESVLADGVLVAPTTASTIARLVNAWSSQSGAGVTAEDLVQAVSEVSTAGVTVSTPEEIRASNCVEFSVDRYPLKWHVAIDPGPSTSFGPMAVPEPGPCPV